tara:strand:+ start:3415 stop:4365 length:951 start_codon:yes stop_codon:yes gene_type:complete
MSTLSGKPVANTYKDLLTVFDGDQNEGIESSLKTVRDGEGVETAIQLSTTTLKIPSGKTLEIAGTLNSVNATLTGDLTVGDDLTVTDLISGASMNLTGNMTSDSATIGGGYGSTGITMTSAGNIQTDGFVYAVGNITTTGRVMADIANIGGGYGDTGCTIGTDGSINSNGSLTIDNRITVGGGYTGSSSGGTGITIEASGAINTDEVIICQAVKTTGGTISSSANDSPKVKLDDATKVALTVDDSGTDKEILKVKDDGEATFKSKAGDTKFIVKDTGVLKYKAKTTAELTAIKDAGNAVAGDIAYDSVKGFVVYVP